MDGNIEILYSGNWFCSSGHLYQTSHMVTIPLTIPPINLFNGCSNLASAFPLCISTMAHSIMHFHSSSTQHVVVLDTDILVILNYYSYFPNIWPIYNHCMANIWSMYNQHTIHMWSTYNQHTTCKSQDMTHIQST